MKLLKCLQIQHTSINIMLVLGSVGCVCEEEGGKEGERRVHLCSMKRESESTDILNLTNQN